MEDFGLQAILEKMNSLNTPLFSGPFWNVFKLFSKIFDDFSEFAATQNSIQIKIRSFDSRSVRNDFVGSCWGEQTFLNSPGHLFSSQSGTLFSVLRGTSPYDVACRSPTTSVDLHLSAK